MVDCEIDHNPADIILTLSIIFGIILSYLPQVLDHPDLFLVLTTLLASENNETKE